jgi:importin subunit alpha-2
MEEGPTFPGLQQLLPALAHLIQNNDGEILADTCEALAGIVFECNEQRAQEVADAGVLPRLVALLDRHEVAIIIPALHTINEIVSASDQATKVIISAGVVAKLTSLLEKEVSSFLKFCDHL